MTHVRIAAPTPPRLRCPDPDALEDDAAEAATAPRRLALYQAPGGRSESPDAFSGQRTRAPGTSGPRR